MFEASKGKALPAEVFPLEVRKAMPKIAVGAMC
jgi:hypothetical protein